MPASPRLPRLAHILFLLLLLLTPLASAAGHPPLRVVMDDQFPPYSFRNETGNLQGLLVDEWRLWEEKTGVSVRLDAMEWAEALRRMEQGEYDVIDTIFRTPSREGGYDFSPPYVRLEVLAFFRNQIEGISTIKTLIGFPVAVKRGDASIELLRQAGVATLLEYPSYEAIIQAAAAGKISVFVMDRPPALYFLYKYGLADQFHHSEPFAAGEFHRAVRKGDSETLALVKRGFAAISDEERQQIAAHWQGEELPVGALPRAILIGIGSMLLLALLLLAWTLTLRRSVRRKTRELEASEARFRALFEAIPELVFHLDRNGVFLDCHAATTEHLLLPPEHFIGRNLAEIFPPEHTAKVMAALTKVLAGRQAQAFDYELTLPDGVRHWYAALMTPCGDREVLVTVRDISARKAAEVELLRTRDAAEAASRAKSEFLATMSHEIRTPLNGIYGMAQLLKLTPLNEKQREYLGVLETSADNLLALINDILDLARIEAGKLILEEQVFSPRACIDEVVAVQNNALRQKGLTLMVTGVDDCPAQVRGDALRFKQILFNLVGNAVKFTERGGIEVAVRVAERRGAQATLEFSVSDTGIGMSEEVLQRLFLPFEQGDSALTRKYGGSGLGLSICRRLIEMMGGRIEVESVPGCGSTFKVLLPFDVSVAPATPVPELAQSLVTPEAAFKLLVVEDNAVNRQLLEILLQQLGHRVVTAANGQEALERWRGDTFDLVLMDIQMPVMDGIEVLRQIRGEEGAQRARRQPVAALTARAMVGERERLLQEGFDAYLTKPFTLARLNEVLELAKPSPSASGDRAP